MVVCSSGFFGDRLADIAERCGADTYVVDSPWGKPADPAALAQELNKHPNVKAVGVVHAETTTGVLSPLQEIIELAHRHGALVVVDAVTSLGGHEMRMDDWDIDDLLQELHLLVVLSLLEVLADDIWVLPDQFDVEHEYDFIL